MEYYSEEKKGQCRIIPTINDKEVWQSKWSAPLNVDIKLKGSFVCNDYHPRHGGVFIGKCVSANRERFIVKTKSSYIGQYVIIEGWSPL